MARSVEVTNETDLVLPASAATLDRERVDRAAEEIREILVRTVNRGIDDIGRYLLREFYDDDPDLYFRLAPTRHASLAKLVERCETLQLPVNKTFVFNALRVAATSKRLPRSSSFHALPQSHRIELARVKEPARVDQLAQRVATKRLPVRRTRVLVQKEVKRTKETRGRKPLPPLVLALRTSARPLRDSNTGELLFTRDDVKALTEEQRELAIERLQSLEKLLGRLHRLLGAAE